MAKASLTTKNTVWLGPQFNSSQTCIAAPGELSGEKGGMFFIEAVTGGAVNGGLWLHTDGTDLLVSTSEPADTNSGTTLGTATGASLALDNLVSVQIDDTLAFKTANTHDIGDDPDSIRTLYWTTSLKKIGTTWDVTLAATEPAAASYTYTFPDVAANADVMLDTGGANAITLTSGTASIALAAGNTDFSIGAAGQLTVGTGTVNFAGSAAFDLATTKTVNIDEDVTIAGGALTTSTAVTLDQDLQASASPTFASVTLSTSLILGDDDRITLGALGATDSYIQYDSANDDLEFYDVTAGGPFTLTQLIAGTPLNPIVTGDLTISDGQFDWTNTTAADVNTWTFANSTADAIHIVANSITSGSILKLESSISGQSGYYIECYDGSSIDFAVKDTGELELLGADATDMLTITKGHIVLSDGKITTSADSNIGSKIARNFTGANSALLELETTHTGDTGVALLVDDKNTAGGTAIDIDSAAITATAGVIDVDAAITTGTVLDINMGTATTSGKGIYVLDDSNDTTARSLIDILQNNTTGSHGAVGLTVTQKGAADGIFVDKDTSGNAISIDADVNSAGVVVGISVDSDNAGAGDAYGVSIADITSGSGNAYALKTNAGAVIFNAGGVDSDVSMYGDTATTLLRWDAGNDRLEFDDGTSVFSFESGTNAFEINAGTAQEPINIGASTDTDFVLHGASAGMDVHWDASDNQMNFLANAELNLDGPIVMSGIQVVLNNQVVDVVHPCTTISTAGGAQAEILVDGQEGQMKYVLMITDNGDYVDTPTNLANGTTITYDDVGDDAFLIFLNGEWHMVGGIATKA